MWKNFTGWWQTRRNNNPTLAKTSMPNEHVARDHWDETLYLINTSGVPSGKSLSLKNPKLLMKSEKTSLTTLFGAFEECMLRIDIILKKSYGHIKTYNKFFLRSIKMFMGLYARVFFKIVSQGNKVTTTQGLLRVKETRKMLLRGERTIKYQYSWK